MRVVDSRGTAMGLGFAVLAAAECAQSGGSAAEVQGAATAVVDNTKTLFYVDTVEYLRRGGRVGTAAALLATSLSVKPLLQMVEGQISALEKVRTSAKAISRLVQLTVAAAGTGPVDIAVHHVAAGGSGRAGGRSVAVGRAGAGRALRLGTRAGAERPPGPGRDRHRRRPSVSAPTTDR